MNFIVPKSDVYKNDAQLCVDSPPAFRFAVQCKLIEYRAKKPRFSHIFHCALMSSHRIVNRRAGDKSTHNYASFLYTSHFCTANIYILNCPDSFDVVCLKAGKMKILA